MWTSNVLSSFSRGILQCDDLKEMALHHGLKDPTTTYPPHLQKTASWTEDQNNIGLLEKWVSFFSTLVFILFFIKSIHWYLKRHADYFVQGPTPNLHSYQTGFFSKTQPSQNVPRTMTSMTSTKSLNFPIALQCPNLFFRTLWPC
jgi:hypothetical protein